ncbi:hypothetical protein SAMN05216503_0719 [Polaribacter sp. KT25b]|nr:hypothetical protein SAMN05216503_0719 [Polaribacter sp. KT25b]
MYATIYLNHFYEYFEKIASLKPEMKSSFKEAILVLITKNNKNQREDPKNLN